MIEAPHETVATALLDAVATGPILDTGGVDRAAVERPESLRDINDNLARNRYRQEHPDADVHDLTAAMEGRRIWAHHGVSWLLEQGHLRTVGEQGLALGKPYKVDGQVYVPGTQLEEGLFHGIRRVIPKRLELLRESVDRLPGLKTYFPVLLDEDDYLVDGRHRRALDPEWPAATRRVPRDLRVAVAVAANRSNAWTAVDWTRLREQVELTEGKTRAGRELARLALLENHERSNRVIGQLVGCDEGTVRSVRAELEETAEIPQFRGQDGRPRKDGSPAQPRKEPKPRKRRAVDPELRRELLRRLDTGDGALEARELSERFDISRGALHTAALEARAAHAATLEARATRYPPPPSEPAPAPDAEPAPEHVPEPAAVPDKTTKGPVSDPPSDDGWQEELTPIEVRAMERLGVRPRLGTAYSAYVVLKAYRMGQSSPAPPPRA